MKQAVDRCDAAGYSGAHDAFNNAMRAYALYNQSTSANDTNLFTANTRLSVQSGDEVEVPALGVGTISTIDRVLGVCLVDFPQALSRVPVRISIDEIQAAGEPHSPIVRHSRPKKPTTKSLTTVDVKGEWIDDPVDSDDKASQWQTERDKEIAKATKPKRKFFVLTDEQRVIEATEKEWMAFWTFSPAQAVLREDTIGEVTVKTEFTPEGKFLVSESTHDLGAYDVCEIDSLSEAQNKHLEWVRDRRSFWGIGRTE